MDAVTTDAIPVMNATTAATPSEVPKPDFDVARYVYFYGLAVILPAGLVCNTLSFAVFLSSRSLRRTTTGHYLSALALADTVFLLGELFRWLNSFDSQGQILGIDFMETMTFWCRTTFFLRYSGKLSSAWITVVITVERFLTVAYPLRVSRISTPKIAKITILIIYILCGVLGSYPYWTIGLIPFKDSTYCGYTNRKAYDAWNMAILRVGSLFLPSAIICIFTALILIFLRRAKKLRQTQLEGQGHQPQTTSVDLQLTIMLISVAIAFIVLRAPYTFTYYINDYKKKLWDPIDVWFSYRIYLANKVCDMIAISNYAVNFFLYCLCGSSFRHRMIRMLTCGKTQPGKRSSATATTNLSSSAKRSQRSNKSSVYAVSNGEKT